MTTTDEERLNKLNNLGLISIANQNFEEAEKFFKKIVHSFSKMAVGYVNLGNLYFDTDNPEKAIKYYEKALLLNDPNFKTYLNRLYLLYKNIFDYKNAERIGNILDKSGYEEPLISLIKDNNFKKNLIVARRKSDQNPFKKIEFRNDKKDKITIAYLSYDFRDHPTAQLLSGVFQHHDRDKFIIYAFSLGPDDKSMWREKIKESVDGFVDVSKLDNKNLLKFIKMQKIDILIDLNGHTSGSNQEVLAQKPAPIIVNYLGFPGTLGSKYHDYIIADKIVIKKNETKYFTEKVVNMPNTYIATNDSWSPIKTSASRKKYNLPKNKFVFASFVQTIKIAKVDLTNWMKILEKTSNSILWINESSQKQKDFIKEIAIGNKVDPKRIFFAKRTPTKDEHFKRLKCVDLLLDTSIYGGHTTTIDGLWAEIPVLTIYGNHFAGRVASSILTTLKIPELITKTNAEYINLAVKIATNKNLHNKISKKIITNKYKTNLFNTKKYTKDLEKIYLKIYEKLYF